MSKASKGVSTVPTCLDCVNILVREEDYYCGLNNAPIGEADFVEIDDSALEIMQEYLPKDTVAEYVGAKCQKFEAQP